MKKVFYAILLSLCLCALGVVIFSRGDAEHSQTGEREQTQPSYEDTVTAEEYLAGMSLEDKAKQLLMVSCHTAGSAKSASEFGAGALCLYGFDFDGKSAEQVIAMNAELQQLADLPMIISTDEEGGSAHRVSSNPKLYFETFRSPGELRMANGFTSAAIDTRSKCVLMENLGLNANLAPVCDVPLRTSDYISDRCFSMDYEECAGYIRAVVSAMQDYNMGSVLKHFPGYGGSTDTHKGVSYDNRPYSAFENGDLLPFKAGIEAGADAVMVSHNIVRCMDEKYPASLSVNVHRVLRENLGFDGVIVTDDLAMGAILNFSGGKNMAVTAILAGNDMVCCSDFEESVQAIVKAVEDGILPQEQVDQSVLRILNWKIKLGLI